MPLITTNSFQVLLPETFTTERLLGESLRATVPDEAHGAQEPMITLGLGELSFYEQYTGESLQERFYSSCAERRYAASVMESGSFQLQGTTGYYCLATASYEFMGQNNDLFYYFAMIPVDDEFCYDFVADCEQSVQMQYQPLFAQTLQSLQWFGERADRAAALDKQNELVESMLSKFGKPAAAPPKPEIPAFTIPVDGQDSFHVAATEFHFLPETEIFIAKLGHTLYADLKAKAQGDINSLQASGLLDDFDDAGEVYLRFDLKGIYQNGVPTGRFQIEDNNATDEQRSLLSCWKGGWQYQLHLYGELVLQDGWLGFNGYFENTYGDQQIYPIQLYKQLPLAELDWSEYQFTSLEEAASAPSDKVQYLYLHNARLPHFPEQLLTYTRLKSLTLSWGGGWGRPPPTDPDSLLALPEDMSRFTCLESLHINHAKLECLPESLCTLPKLNRLNITHCALSTIPSALFRSPCLQHLDLNKNQLSALPENIDLPELVSLRLEGNRLTSLPAALLDQPKLNYLYLQHNPWESLPEGIERIPHLSLELADKQRLLDFTYRSADGTLAQPVEKRLFATPHDPSLLPQLDTAIDECGLQDYLAALHALALKTVTLKTGETDDYSQVGNTRFGGMPDLPESIPYPTFGGSDTRYAMEFIAQLNCAELAHLQDYLPRSGMLYFFVEEEEDFGCKVIYFNGDTSQLCAGNTLPLPAELFDSEETFTPCRVATAAAISLPCFYADDDYLTGEAAILQDKQDELEPGLGKLSESFQYGFDRETRQSTHRINSYVFKQHDTPQIEAAHVYKGQPQDYMVLLAVASDHKTGFQFWDAGEIYFVIHKSDLLRQDFSQVFCGLESS